jgi:hypothetical protein
MEAPDLSGVMSYKGVYALSTINHKTGQLKATHFACCVISGPRPVWAVWNVSGRFQRFFGLKSEIESHYPQLVWRRKMAAWNLTSVHNPDVKTRIHELEETYHSTIKRD